MISRPSEALENRIEAASSPLSGAVFRVFGVEVRVPPRYATSWGEATIAVELTAPDSLPSTLGPTVSNFPLDTTHTHTQNSRRRRFGPHSPSDRIPYTIPKIICRQPYAKPPADRS